MAAHPAPGAGTECGLTSADDCGVPRNTTIELRFDRYLLPSTAVRQSIAIYSGSEEVSLFSQPVYDVVERVVIFRPLGELAPGARYTVELRQPKEDDDFGFRAFDQAPIAEGDVPLSFDFRTKKTPPSAAEVDAARDKELDPENKFAKNCDVFPALGPKQAGCATPTCHGGETPRMGLKLGGLGGLTSTAIGEVAHQTESGAQAGVPLRNPPRMGVNMPVIEAKNPANSYLLYKLLINPSNFNGSPGIGCESVHSVPLPPGVCPEPTREEVERLTGYFVRGLPMPYNDRSVDLRKLQSWIRAHASESLECE